MDNAYPPEAWRHLGEVLERRRGQLGYGFRQREQFLRDRGGPPPSVKTLARLERGERTFYPDATVALLEALYGYAPGSFEKILRYEEPEELPHPGPAAPAVPRNPFEGPAGPAPEPEGDEAWEAFPDPADYSMRMIWRDPYMKLSHKLALVDLLKDLQRESQPPGRESAGLATVPECHDPDTKV